MTEAFNRAQEICANQFDDKAQTQLVDLLRQEFLNSPPGAHHIGRNETSLNDGKLTLSASFIGRDEIGDNPGMAAVVKCDEPRKYVRVDTNSKGEMNGVDVMKNGQFVSQDRILTIHGK